MSSTGDGEHEQHGDGADEVGQRPVLDRLLRSGTSRSFASTPSVEWRNGTRQLVDAVPDEREERGHQRDARREPPTRPRSRRAVPTAAMNGRPIA